MRVIYIDVLFFLNFYITYFLIIGACCITHRKISIKKRILGSAAGGIASFVILLPQIPLILSLLGKLFISLLLTLISMGLGGWKEFFKNAFVFFGVNCVYVGTMLALWVFWAPAGMVYNNGVSYFQLPIWVIFLATAAAYFILKFIRRMMDSKGDLDKKYELEIITEKGNVRLRALPDSGNKLVDFFSGLPVIFCDFEKCREICPDEIIVLLSSGELSSEFMHGVRLIPCSTVAGADNAICFKPKNMFISDEKSRKEIDALVGFTKNGLCTEEFDAVFSPNIL